MINSWSFTSFFLLLNFLTLSFAYAESTKEFFPPESIEIAHCGGIWTSFSDSNTHYLYLSLEGGEQFATAGWGNQTSCETKKARAVAAVREAKQRRKYVALVFDKNGLISDIQTDFADEALARGVVPPFGNPTCRFYSQGEAFAESFSLDEFGCEEGMVFKMVKCQTGQFPSDHQVVCPSSEKDATRCYADNRKIKAQGK